MEPEGGAADKEVQQETAQQTAGGGQQSQRRRRRRRRQRQRASQSEGPHTYAQVAAASQIPASPSAADPELTAGRENLDRGTNIVLSPSSHQPGSRYTFPSDSSNQAPRQVGDVGLSTSPSQTSQNIPPPTQSPASAAAAAAQQLSRSAKKRRKRQARKNYLRGLTEEQNKPAQRRSDSEKGDEDETPVEGRTGSIPSTRQPAKSREDESGTEVLNGSASSTQQPAKNDEDSTRTAGPSGIIPSTQQRGKDDEDKGSSGSISSTQQPAKVDEGETHTEVSDSSVTSTPQQKSPLGDGQNSQNIPSPSAMKPGTSNYLSTFPSLEEIRKRVYFGARTRTTSRSKQGRSQEDTKSSADTEKQKELEGAEEDAQSEKLCPSRCSTPTELSGSRSKDEYGGGGGGSCDEDSPDTGSFRSSIIVEYAFEDNYRDVQQERDREEYIMGVVSNCFEMVSTMTGQLNQSIREIFSDLVVPNQGAGPSNANVGNGISLSGAEEIDVPEYNVTHEDRLERLCAYIYEAYLDDISQPQGAAEMVRIQQAAINTEGIARGLMAQEEPMEDPTSQESSRWNLPVEEECSTSSRVEPSSSESTKVEVVQSSNQVDSAASEREKMSPQKLLLSVATVRVFKMKGSCRMLLNGLLSLMDIISLALEAYRVVQRVVERAIRPPYAALNGVARLVTDAATATSERLHNALCDAERAVRIHSGFSQSLAELGKLLDNLRRGQPPYDETPERTALLNTVLELLERNSTFINLDLLTIKNVATGSASAVPSSSQGEGSAGESLGRDPRERPSEGFEALLLATRSSVDAVQAAMNSLDVIYVTELSIAGETQEDTDDSD